MKPETKFYANVKKNIKNISWIRIENLSVPGTPDLLGYNNNGVFFTVELKVTKAEPAVKGDTVTSTNKIVTCETGLEISVPMFIEENEIIKIDTKNRNENPNRSTYYIYQ